MRLAHAQPAPGKPGKAGARGGHRLLHPGILGKGDATARGVDGGEEFGVLAAAAAERKVEAPAGDARGGEAHQHVAGIAGSDFAVHPDGARGVEVAAAHPVGRLRPVERAHRAEHHVGPAFQGHGEQPVEPERIHRLVVVDEGDEIGIRVVEAGVAGDRDVAGRAMHIDDVRRQQGHGGLDAGTRARLHVVVGDDDAEAHARRNDQLGERGQRLAERGAPEGADRDVDAKRRRHASALRLRKSSTSRQKPADQAKCMIMAETAASGP